MDCQGYADIRRNSLTLDNLIMFLALQLSDMHILNLRGTLGARDFEQMSVSRICFNDKVNVCMLKNSLQLMLIIVLRTALHFI